MVFELLGARMQHAFRIQSLFRIQVNHLLHKIERGEHIEEKLVKDMERYVQQGLVDGVMSAHVSLAKKSAGNEKAILDLEVRSILQLFDEFIIMYKGVKQLADCEDIIRREYSHLSPATQKKTADLVKKINSIITKDIEITYEIMLQLARAFRDQYHALLETEEGKQARERLREMIIGPAFKDLMEHMKLRGAHKAARRLTKDVHKEQDVIGRLDTLLRHLAQKPQEKEFIKQLELLERIIRDEGEQIEEFMKDTRIYLFLVIRHHFTILGYLLKLHQNEKLLEEQHFPKKALQSLLKVSNEELGLLEKKSRNVEQQSYQLYHRMKKLKEETSRLKLAA